MADKTNKPKLQHSQEDLELLLRYEPQTGKLFWRERPLRFFSSERAWRSWNSRLSGKEVSIRHDAYGYAMLILFDRQQKAHQVICRMVYGSYTGIVDHINGVRNDNRIENLRIVERRDNQRNMARPVNNKSGHIGVVWHKAASKWHAQIKTMGKNNHLGLFDLLEDAVAARKVAEAKFGFHPNHGRA